MPQFDLFSYSTLVLTSGVSFCIYYCFIVGDCLQPINTSLGFRETFIGCLKRLKKRITFQDDTPRYYQLRYLKNHYPSEFFSDKYYKKKIADE